MPLTIYRRHSKKCPYHGKPRNARNSRPRCSIYVQGSLGGRYIRAALDLTYWDPAVELVQRWEKAGRIERLPLRLSRIDEPVGCGKLVRPLVDECTARQTISARARYDDCLGAWGSCRLGGRVRRGDPTC